MLRRLLFIWSVWMCAASAFAQNTRINTYGNIGWYNYFGTVRFTEKWSAHTEYQWRRDEWISRGQQSLLRVGVNYQWRPQVLLRLGYGWIETYAYGDIPINALGRTFTEHRIFQMLQLSSKEGRFEFSHRFMLEQRFVGKYNSSASEKEDSYPLLNRLRYMLRVQVPLNNAELKDKTLYAALYNEVFIGFGKNVNANVFDQNRLGALLGYRFNGTMKIEGGYLQQILQFGREIGGKNVFQNNHGVLVNAIFNIDARKKEPSTKS